MKIIKLTVFILMSSTITHASDQSLYDHALKTIDGIHHTRGAQGKVILMVNASSRCGFTRQYKGLKNSIPNIRTKAL